VSGLSLRQSNSPDKITTAAETNKHGKPIGFLLTQERNISLALDPGGAELLKNPAEGKPLTREVILYLSCLGLIR
jgi:hypothetical protein